MRNVELKAQGRSIVADRTVCRRLGARRAGVFEQRDTYFAVRRGRLKLREQKPGEAELIAYLRPDERRERVCSYAIVPVERPAEVRRFLGECLGVLADVRKTRELFFLDGVRIHLDRVRRLGTYLEFEAVLAGRRGAAWGRATIRRLSAAFGIRLADTVSGSYLDLILARE